VFTIGLFDRWRVATEEIQWVLSGRPRNLGFKNCQKWRRLKTAQPVQAGGGECASACPNVWQLGGFPPHLMNVYLIGDVLIDAVTRWSGRRILRQLGGHKLSLPDRPRLFRSHSAR
jgi:hypothetical protein